MRAPRRSPAILTLLVMAVVSPAGVIGPATRSSASTAVGFTAKPVVTGLAFPAAFTFAPNGRIFYGDKDNGEIHVFDAATHHDHVFFRFSNMPATSGTERGLLGIALNPHYPRKPFVYAYVTRRRSGGAIDNEIVRLRNDGGHGINPRILFAYRLSSATNHNGGRIEFGPDGLLYAVVGENGNSANSQDLKNPRGKVLRMTPSGRPAPGNPFGNRVFSFGLRNSFGFDFDPRTGHLWESENGPECNDELNRIVKGGNFGWGPAENCGGTSPQDTNNSGSTPRILPKRWYTPTIAPTGLVFCHRCGLGSVSNGRLFFGAYKTGQVRRVKLTSNRLGVASQAVVYTHGSGIMSMEASPNGHVFFSDSQGIYRLVLG